MHDPLILEKIIKAVREVIEPDKIILFGSQARGDAGKESDYDVLVVKTGIENPLILEQDIYEKLIGVGISIDLLVRTPELIEKDKDKINSFIPFALSEGLVVYG